MRMCDAARCSVRPRSPYGQWHPPAPRCTVGKGDHNLTPSNGHAMLSADLLMHAFALSIMRAALRLPARNRVAAW